MAILRNGLTIVAVLVIFYFLEKEKFIDFTCLVPWAHHDNEHFGAHTREKRSESPVLYEYVICVEVNAADTRQLTNILEYTTFPVHVGTQINITDALTVTACSVTPTSPPTTPFLFEYVVSIELNISNGIDGLRTILINISYPITINNQIEIHEINIFTDLTPLTTSDVTRTTTETTPTITATTNSTPVTTTHVNTTTTITVTTNSTPLTTSDVPRRTTEKTSTITAATNSTPVATTHVNMTNTTITVTRNSTPFTTPDVTRTTETTPTISAITNMTSVAASRTTTLTTAVTNTTTVAPPHVNMTTTPTITVTTNTTPLTPSDVTRTTTETTPTITVTTNTTPLTPSDVTRTTTETTPTITVTTNTTLLTPSDVTRTTTETTPTITVTTNTTPLTPSDVTRTTTETTPTITVTTNTTPLTPSDVTRTTTETTPTITVTTNTTPLTPSDVTRTTTETTPTITVTTNTTPLTPSDVTRTTTEATPTITVTTNATPLTPSDVTRTTTETTPTITAITKKTSVATSRTTTRTTALTTTATRASTVTATVGRVFQVQVSVTLDLQYTTELSDSTSAEYMELTSKIEPVLNDVYSGLTGFISSFVQKYSPGSVITAFVVETTTVISSQIISANEKLKEEIKVVAPVIGVYAFYKSSEPFSHSPNITYTGNKLQVTCGQPDNFDVGQLSGSVWIINGKKLTDNSRVTIITSDSESTLEIKNVILADSGNYECTLVGKALDFLQQADLQEGVAIRQVPNVRVPSRVNVGCIEGPREPLMCCVQSNYRVKLFRDATVLDTKVVPDKSGDYCIQHNYTLNNCDTPLSFVCRVDDPKGYEITTTITIFKGGAVCKDTEYGIGQAGDISTIECNPDQKGSKTAVCESNGKWKLKEDTCILIEVNELLIESQDAVQKDVPEIVAKLNAVVQSKSREVTNSSATIMAVVDIIKNVASVATAVNKTVMQDILQTVEIIIGDDARESWNILNANETLNASSTLLASLERLSKVLVGEFTIQTQNILLNRTTFDNSFSANLNSTVTIDIPNTNTVDIFITTIVFATLRNALPPRNASFNVSSFSVTTNKTLNDTINAAVMLVSTNATINDVTMSFTKVNNSLKQNAQCVFWNFRLLDDLGAWDHEGCTFVSDIDNIITCNCSHLTSFSILMATSIPESLRLILDIITYIGVGISLASLLICLIIEGYVWKTVTRNSTAFMRHVSVVNIALALLIADICFIIGAAVAKNPGENPGEDYHTPVGPCSSATFFMHFFYLALFFWMLVSALLLLYRTLLVFSHMSKKAMLAVGFSLGYGCPLIIAVVTVAVTAPGNMYIRRSEACWLNWHESMALLAFVVPALVIVLINFIILIVVLIKMLRRGAGDASQPGEKNALIVILRCVAFLTPLFGLTWGLGVGTMTSPTNKGIHIAFAFFNSLQGFFILFFGTIFDSKIRAVLARTLPTLSSRSNRTQSTSGGASSSSVLNFIRRIPGRRRLP
ncbi:adhesion G protein-coupled receptor F5-like isoform X2 [Thalassophryne amazonica]|uniref:adhesion G protein-coupled receptor F5-like isoform X2 n=1 Tax=Thalassophryne amazonica TaxID=390379 RepID=UPI0014710261|nr:adhesion G protein-coupled receptor F5-like isoform X2 [Thalassophryne amazonica]